MGWTRCHCYLSDGLSRCVFNECKLSDQEFDDEIASINSKDNDDEDDDDDYD